MIGPDDNFFRGKPLVPQDRGGLFAAFSVSKTRRLGVMDFGTVLDWVAATPHQARKVAGAIRAGILKNFGNLPYDITTLPIIVTGNKEKQIIEVKLPQRLAVLAANPEMWLALAERLDTVATELVGSANVKLEEVKSGRAAK